MRTVGADAISRPTSTFCTFPPRKAANGSARARSHDFQTIDDILRQVLRIFSVEEDGFALAVASQHHIVDDVHIAYQPHAQTVLGDKGKAHAELPNLHGRFIAEVYRFVRLRIEIGNFSAFDVLKSRDRFEKFSLTAARDPRDA